MKVKTNYQTTKRGKVLFIGAGPGDPELLTVKAARLLSEADVVLTDRLANKLIVQTHAPQALVVEVGKNGVSGISTSQKEINNLMVHYAKEGNTVVRLKGGDISVFSNIATEIETLQLHKIPFQCVPGISAALGVAATTHMPLTARGLATGVRLLTYYANIEFTTAQWTDMATANDTLVFYMAGQSINSLIQALMQHGMHADTPVMLAEKATTPAEQLRVSTLQNCLQDWSMEPVQSPALIVIGKVVSLSSLFQQEQDLFVESHTPIIHLQQQQPNIQVSTR